MSIEVILSDSIGVATFEIEADTGIEAVIIAATEYVTKSIREGFVFEGFKIEIDATVSEGNRIGLVFFGFEGNDADSDPIYFESIY